MPELLGTGAVASIVAGGASGGGALGGGTIAEYPGMHLKMASRAPTDVVEELAVWFLFQGGKGSA